MPKPQKQNIINAIVKQIESGTSYGTSLAQSGTKWHISKRTFDRYWKEAQEQHIAKQQGIKEAVAIVEVEQAIEARKKEILTAQERKEILTEIALGKIEIPTKEAKWDSEQKKFVMLPVINLPDHGTRIRAITELNKMGGDYASTKVEVTGEDGKPIETKNTQVIVYLPDNGRTK
jgi:DNA primase large subunit